MIVKTGRFGQLNIGNGEKIQIPQGVLGFPDDQSYCLVDPGDETLILWLQSLENPEIVFPVLEPKVFYPSYAARLSAAELRELHLVNVSQAAVFSILTIPEDVTLMSANLKAPLIINLKEQLAKQVVLQENEYSIKYLMFKELKAHLITMQAQRGALEKAAGKSRNIPISIKDIPPSLTVKSLQS